ncbi:MAG: prolipoprotein diacylglyceryl transferase [Bacillota bacterium]|jgi:phosphatidylglycerol:prolipoprotein diacylglycerol transferase|nr:prolipoprotein diacylglyceryl transferase [Candidatus Fermentithermobacillaceae bacterium]
MIGRGDGMRPVIFTIGGVEFYSYGLMVGLGYVLGALVAMRMARKKGVDPDSLLGFFLLLFVSGVLGGRLLHMALNPAGYPDLKTVLDLRDGGLSIYGVLMGGIIAVGVYCRVKRVRLGQLFDIVVPGVALGQSIGRWGCLLNGCCYGRLTGDGWGVLTRYAPGLRHPYPVYESVADFLLFALLLRMSERVPFEGGLFLIYMAGYSGIRFALEFFRDSHTFVAGLSHAQWFSALLFAASLGAFAYLKRKTGVENRPSL